MPIKIKKLNHIYNPNTRYAYHSLIDLSLEIKDHTFNTIIGQTGCGKSTLLQHLNGLLLPYSGKIEVDSFIIDVSNEYKDGKINEHLMKKKRKKKYKNIKELRQRVGVAFQFPESQLFEETVLKDVMFGPRNFNLSLEEAEKQAKEALSLLGLDSSFYLRNPFDLSGGEKRKVSLAGILAFKPDILVLDEPTVGLDKESKSQLLNTLKSLKEKGITIIISTHDMDVVLEYSDNVFLLEKGKLILNTNPSDLFTKRYSLLGGKEEVPKVISFANLLKNKGYKIDISKVKNIDTLVSQIKGNL